MEQRWRERENWSKRNNRGDWIEQERTRVRRKRLWRIPRLHRELGVCVCHMFLNRMHIAPKRLCCIYPNMFFQMQWCHPTSIKHNGSQDETNIFQGVWKSWSNTTMCRNQKSVFNYVQLPKNLRSVNMSSQFKFSMECSLYWQTGTDCVCGLTVDSSTLKHTTQNPFSRIL